MEWFPASKDHLPLTWWKQTPVYLATVIALAGVASLILTVLVMAVNPAWLLLFTFSLHNVLNGWIWTPLTYVFVNPPGDSSQILWFLLGTFMLHRFVEAIERHLGRWSFVKLLTCFWLAPPLVLSTVGLLGPRLWMAVGINPLEFGVFLAFAALYPSARISLIVIELEAWVLGSIYVVAEVLVALAYQGWPRFFIIAGQAAVAIAYIRYEQGRLQLPAFLTRPKRTSPSKPKPSVQRDAKKPAGGAKILDLSDVDDILEKISRHGIASLTEAEKRTLEQASDKLGKRRP